MQLTPLDQSRVTTCWYRSLMRIFAGWLRVEVPTNIPARLMFMMNLGLDTIWSCPEIILIGCKWISAKTMLRANQSSNFFKVRQIWDRRILPRSINEGGSEFSNLGGDEMKESFAMGKEASEREQATEIYVFVPCFFHVTRSRGRACWSCSH